MSKQSSARFAGYSGDTTVSVQRLSAVKTDQQVRTSVGMEELDRVLGGGLVAGSVVLIGGDPGIGKSTLLLQVLSTLSDKLDSLYVTGEESAAQVRLRAERLGAHAVNERGFVCEPVPWAVVELGETPRFVDADRIQPLLVVVTVGLPPEQVIHDFRCFDQDADHLSLLVAQMAQVGGEREIGVDLRPRLRFCYSGRCRIRGRGRSAGGDQ